MIILKSLKSEMLRLIFSALCCEKNIQEYIYALLWNTLLFSSGKSGFSILVSPHS